MVTVSRRGALSAATAFTASGLVAGRALATPAKASTKASVVAVKPFPLKQVRLKPSVFSDAVDANARYLLSLSADRLLHNFRANAGLQPKGERYGGWEAQGIAGHSLGHYHSAVALMYAQTGRPEFRERALYITRELAEIQENNCDGYAGGTTVDRDGKTIDGKVVYEELRKGQIDTHAGLNGGWVPLYTYHKVLAGALDAHALCDDPQSLKVAIGLGNYVGTIFEGLSDAQLQQIFSIEFGGMAESFAELYARTGDKRWKALSERSRHRQVLDALAAGRDELAGKHANTQIPKVIGLARLYELDPSPQHRDDSAKAALFFWETVTKDHSYVIGGNSEYEHFGEPKKLARRLGQQTCESCNSYNMLKLTRHLYGWSGDARYFDYYERAHLNHILAQHDPKTGMFTYFMPLASGYGRVHSTPDNDFWCCVGTGMESHSKHADSVWWRKGSQVLVNLYYPSTLDWSERGVKLDMDTAFPRGDAVEIRVTAAKTPVDLALRVPDWSQGASVTVNGKPAGKRDGGYIALTGLKAGDRVALKLPMAIHTESLPDDDRLVAFLNGPLVLAADLGPSYKPWQDYDPAIVAESNDGVLKRTGDWAFTFGEAGKPGPMTLKPYFDQYDNRTAVYFRRFTGAEWPAQQAAYIADAKARADITARTIDVIRLGEQQPEQDHNFAGTPNTATITHIAERGRNISQGYFEFDLVTAPGPLELQVSYIGDARNKAFDILVDGKLLTHETLPGEPTVAKNVRTYAMPVDMTDAPKVRVRFESKTNQWFPVYECRLVKAAVKQA